MTSCPAGFRGELLRPCWLMGCSAPVCAGVSVQLSDGRSVSCQVLVGADGAESVVARELGLPATKYVGYKAYR